MKWGKWKVLLWPQRAVTLHNCFSNFLHLHAPCSKIPAFSNEQVWPNHHHIPLRSLLFTCIVSPDVCLLLERFQLGTQLLFLVDVHFLWYWENFVCEPCKYSLGFTPWCFPIISLAVSHFFMHCCVGSIGCLLTEETEKKRKWVVPSHAASWLICHPFIWSKKHSSSYVDFYLLILFIDFGKKEEGTKRERNIDLLFHLFMHSLVTSSMGPDQGSNP